MTAMSSFWHLKTDFFLPFWGSIASRRNARLSIKIWSFLCVVVCIGSSTLFITE